MSRYSWVKDSFSIVGAFPTTPQVINLAIPAKSTVKRFQIRGTYISMYHQNPDASHVCAPKMDILIEYLQFPAVDRIVYRSSRRIPASWTVFEAAVVPVYDFQANAGDLELGVDQACGYGKLTGPAADLRLTTYVFAYPVLNSDYLGEWDLEFAALVFT